LGTLARPEVLAMNVERVKSYVYGTWVVAFVAWVAIGAAFNTEAAIEAASIAWFAIMALGLVAIIVASIRETNAHRRRLAERRNRG
jgi:hypothetical protein